MRSADLDALVSLVAERLEPRLLIVGEEIVRRARAEAKPLIRPASVLTFDATSGDTTVVVDGDDEDTDAQCITAYPLREGDRVYVLFSPPHGVYVVGHALGFPIIAGYDDTGLSTNLAAAPAYTTIKTVTVGDVPLGRAYRIVARTDVTIYSFTAGQVEAEVLLEVSIDGGATWTPAYTTLTAAGNDIFANAGVTVSATGSSNEHRPMIRVSARRNTSEVAATYDLRDVFTSWTVTPQD